VVVRCTKKMLEVLGGRSLTLSELPPTEDDWYLNLLWIDRQKCILLTHAGTLFSIFRADVRRADLRPIGNYLVAAVETELRAESLPTDTFSQLQPDSVQLARTASRSTLGFMNEMAFELRYLIADAGGPRTIRHRRPQPWAPSHATQPRRIRPPDRTRRPPAHLTHLTAITSALCLRLPKKRLRHKHACQTARVCEPYAGPPTVRSVFDERPLRRFG
jgi:Domain of unknown function (DUF6933)